MNLTLQQCKDQVARSKGFSDWNDLLKFQFTHLIDRDRDEASVKFASEKIKEALELAAARATTKQSDDFGLYWVDKSSILNLLPELIENLNKEI